MIAGHQRRHARRRHAHGQPLALAERVVVREQRRGVRVGPEPEQDEVEPRHPVAERRPQLRLVGVGAGLRAELALASASRPARRPASRSSSASLDHAVVRVLVVRRHAALVAEPQRGRATSRVHRRGALVGRARRRAARRARRGRPRRPSAASRSAAAAAGSGVTTTTRLHFSMASAAPRAPAGRSGRAAAPGGCPRRGSRPRRARRPAPSSRLLARLRVRRRGRQPARAAVERDAHARGGLDRDAGQARHAHGRVGLEAQLDVLAARRARARRASRPARSACRAPSRAARRASRGSSSAARSPTPGCAGPSPPRSGRSSSRHCGGSKVRGDPLAPRRRAQPGEVDDVGLLGQLARARDRRLPGRARSTESISTTWARCEQRVDRLGMAVRRPDERREVGHQQRVDDRVEPRQVLRARRRPRRARGRGRARPGAGRPGVIIVAHASIAVRPGSTAHRIVREGW